MCVGAGVGDRSRMARVGCEGAAPVLELAHEFIAVLVIHTGPFQAYVDGTHAVLAESS